MQPMQGLIEGRVVHFVMFGAFNVPPETPLRHRAADVVEVIDAERGVVALHVKLAPSDPEMQVATFLAPQPILVLGHVSYDEAMVAGTWHWIERA